MLLSVALLALLASVQGRAVNISNTWVLPEEGFPVFYRYFRDRISWYEADAVCQFHHANLVTVDTTAQYDAVRAYLKELDISSSVWVGLIRSNPDGDFTWTDYRGLSGEGYWSSAPDARAAPLCAAADPVADYRWEARACGGPSVASFICELPVPQWALGNEGCMVRALPALTILYLPESAAVQLTADCGMASVKKVQCTGNVKREDLLKQLSCAVEEELSTTNLISTGSNWPVTTDSTFTEQDVTNEVATEETITTEHEVDINQPHDDTATSLPRFIYSQAQSKIPTKVDSLNKLNNALLSKNINLAGSDNNLQSNIVPNTVDEDNVLTNDQLEKLEDERHKQHKMFHEEIARVGNVDNIFTQPTDHFIPPLVMAKARISDDMTVLSLAEKHAQQLAEKQFIKQNLNKAAVDNFDNREVSKESTIDNIDKLLIATIKPAEIKESKQDILKYHSPKKYFHDKYYDVKPKAYKLAEGKLSETNKQLITPVTSTLMIDSATKDTENLTTTKKYFSEDAKKSYFEDDSGMNLTVLLNDAPFTSEKQSSFSGDVPLLETIQNNKFLDHTDPNTDNITTTSYKKIEIVPTLKTQLVENITMQHDIIKITIISDDGTLNNTAVFDVTTKIPVFKDSELNGTALPFSTSHLKESNNTDKFTTTGREITTTTTKTDKNEFKTSPEIYLTSTIDSNFKTDNKTTNQAIFTTTEIKTTTEIATTAITQNELNITEHGNELENTFKTTSLPIIVAVSDNTTSAYNVTATSETDVKTYLNNSEYHEMLLNMTDHKQDDEENTTDDDFQSPLLSGVMEPMHRPPRTRRPQQPNRNKFNPFRILG